jgi:hypothetical protein
MTMLTAAQNTYAAIGIREDLQDMVYRIDPEETPFQSNVATNGVAKNTLHEWQTQGLAAASTNYQLEGDDTAASAATARVRLTNRCVISKKVFTVTGTNIAVNVAGITNELDEQRLLKGIELKRDMEIVLLANQAIDAGGTTSARKCGGLAAYTTLTDTTGWSGTAGTNWCVSTGTGVDDWSVGTGASARALTLSIINGTLLSVRVAGGKPTIMMLPPFLKQKFSNQALSTGSGAVQVRSNLQNGGAAANVVGTVDTFLSDFGPIASIDNVQMAAETTFLSKCVYFIDPRYLSVAFLRQMQGERLAQTGDGQREHVLAEYTLAVGAPTANGILVNITS